MNYYKLFVNFLEQKGVAVTLFSFKDQRFGCLSRAATRDVRGGLFFCGAGRGKGKNPRGGAKVKIHGEGQGGAK